MPSHSRSGVARRMGRLTIVTSAGALTWGSGSQSCRAMVGKACCTPRTEIAYLRLGTRRRQMDRLTSKKNAIAEATGRTAGFWHAVYRYAIHEDAPYAGTVPTPICNTATTLERSCSACHG